MSQMIKGYWRLFQPIKNYLFKYPIELIGSYIKYAKSLQLYKKSGGSDAQFRYLAPQLYFKNEDVQTGGGHYFYQDIWALRKLNEIKPLMHYDIGSRFDGFVGQATAIAPVTCIDIRPPKFILPDFHFIQGDILNLSFESSSLATLSCLHTIEHIGLGRYGDAINPNGFNEALMELQRVVAKDGFLILSMPVGLERTEFNAQRVLSPLNCIKQLTEMALIEFSIVDESDHFISNANPLDYINSKYCCGLYLFKKK